MKTMLNQLVLLCAVVFIGCSHIEIAEHSPISTSFSTDAISVIDSTFCYYYSEKVYLKEHKNMLIINFVDNVAKQQIMGYLSNEKSGLIQEQSILKSSQGNTSNIAILKSQSGNFSKNIIEELKSTSGVTNVSYLLEYEGFWLSSTSQVIVKVKNDNDLSELEDLADKFSSKIIHNSWLGNNTYILSIPSSSKYSSIELANLLNETEVVEYATPDFFVHDALCSTDTYYNDQWYLRNSGQFNYLGVDINIEGAWQVTEGDSDVVVAIVDTGIDLTHPDLMGQLLPGYNTITSQPGGGYAQSNHGTNIAGVIGAIKDNNIGIAGIAPNCKILPIRSLVDYGYSFSAMIAGVRWAVDNGADVINCSWSAPGICPTLTEAINYATTSGRNGKGCVVVFGAGNEERVITYPANLPRVIAVGALTFNNTRKKPYLIDGEPWGSSYGEGLDIVAPGVRIATTDVSVGDRQSLDYTDTRYTNYFTGTSAAAAQVSGVAALILSKYPDFTCGQVSSALIQGASLIPGYSFQESSTYPPLFWNNEVGHGRLNAGMSLTQAAVINQQSIIDSQVGFDFRLTNNSDYYLDQIYIHLSGLIDGQYQTLVYCEPGGIGPEEVLGVPVYRGESLFSSPGTIISDIELEVSATIEGYDGNVRIGAAIDNQFPNPYYDCAFGQGNSFTISISNTTVPNASRRMLYINVINPY